MSANDYYSDRGTTSAQTTLADSCSITTVGPTLGQRWRYVGKRLSLRSRHDVGPDNVSRFLLDDDCRVNVGLTLEICLQPIVIPIAARRRPKWS